MAINFSATQRNARISAQKVRLSADLIRGKSVEQALTVLEFDNRRGSYLLRKVLQSAVANAQSRGGLDPLDMQVSQCFVDEGWTLKRWKPCGRGRIHGIKKRCSHINVVVAAVEE
jgi:large subunit ribosomal protein L22